MLVVRVHPELVKAERIPDAKVDDEFWADRFDDINAFERHLTRNGTVVLKFFLHVSKDEQRKRFLKRLEDPQEALEVRGRRPRRAGLLGRLHEGLRGRDQRHQHQVGPLVHHPRRPQVGHPRLVARIVASTIESLDLRYPEVTAEQQAAIEQAKRQLEEE